MRECPYWAHAPTDCSVLVVSWGLVVVSSKSPKVVVLVVVVGSPGLLVDPGDCAGCARGVFGRLRGVSRGISTFAA